MYCCSNFEGMSKISLIIHREYMARVRKRTFILTTILTPLLMLSLMVGLVLVMRMDSDQTAQIVVIDNSKKVGPALESNASVVFTLTQDSTHTQAINEPKYSDAYGFLVIGEDIISNPSNLNLYTRKSSTLRLEQEVTDQISSIVERERIAAYNIAELDSIIRVVEAHATIKSYQIDEMDNISQSSSSASMAIAYMGGFIIYMFVFMYGAMVMQGVIEEKSNRVIEVIVSSVKPFELMMGKILGIALVALTQVAIWVGVVLVLGAAQHYMFADMVSQIASPDADMAKIASMQGINADALGAIQQFMDPGYLLAIFVGFLVFFVGGYLLYAAMFAAIGSAVDNVQDTQQLQIPVTVPLILALMVMMNVMGDPHSSLAFWFSIIPFTSPIIMVARLPYGVPLWELALAAFLLYATFVGMTYFAGKIYRTGIFMYGKKPSLKEVIKWSKFK